MQDQHKTKAELISEVQNLREQLEHYRQPAINSYTQADRALIILNIAVLTLAKACRDHAVKMHALPELRQHRILRYAKRLGARASRPHVFPINLHRFENRYNTYQFVGLLDLRGKLLETNQASLDAAGATGHEVIGKPVWQTIWWRNEPEAQAQLKDAIRRASNGETARFESTLFAGRADRTPISVDYSIKPVRNDCGEVIYLLTEGRDITDMKRDEAKLLHQQEELARNQAALARTCGKAESMFLAYSELPPGTVLDGKYQIRRKIGAGGFGIVYQATHLELNREVAIKVFHPSIGNTSSADVERFRLEGISACRVHHPNAVKILDAGLLAENVRYLVMELLTGRTLKKELSMFDSLSPSRSIEIILPLGRVLAEAHGSGIIHRDIKPDNIFLHQAEGKEVVKLIDFGIAKLADESLQRRDSGITENGTVVGTPAYISPERATNKPYDGRTDIYSLGITLYEMLTGRLPFDPEEHGFFEALLMHVNKIPVPPRQYNSHIPEELETLVLRMLAKDPKARPTAAALVKELKAIKSSLDLSRAISSTSLPTLRFLDTQNLVLRADLPDPARTIVINK